jgi:hypothetical protein
MNFSGMEPANQFLEEYMEQIISNETKERLIRYANAVERYESERRRIWYRDGSHLEIPPGLRTITERSEARADLLNCPEPDIKALVHTIQLERIDEAMTDETKTEPDVITADHDAMLANNELIYLGQKFRIQETQIQPHRRRKDVRRNRRTRWPGRRSDRS